MSGRHWAEYHQREPCENPKKADQTMKPKHFSILFVSLLLFSLFPNPGLAGKIAPAESDRIVALVYKKYIPVYTKYLGVESVSKSIIREYDGKTNALKRTSEVTVRRKDYFYKEPEVQVLSFKKDGEDKDPSDHRLREAKPGHPVFDRKGTDHYIVKVINTEMIGKIECYRLDIQPKKPTARHFKGDIYLAVDTLDVVRTVGGAGSLDFPVKHFRAAFDYTLVDSVSVAQSGTIEVRIDFPVIYPDMLIITDTTIIESRPF
jgi:hypothetical protein